MTNFTILRRKTLAIALMATLPIFSSLAAAEEQKRGGTLVVGSTQALRHVNGAVQSGIATAMPSTQIFASPLRFDDKWNAQPYLAEKWSLAADGKSLTLNLRKGAVFHDGKPITSEDVAFSI
ncbi:MAG: ABC transporter substrate-binding protein, partial [Limnohabitans sp.]